MHPFTCTHANTRTHRQSYDVTVELDVPGSGVKSQSTYDLKNPNFRYMTTPLSVPGTLHTAPTDTYFQDTPTSVAAPAPLLQAPMTPGNQLPSPESQPVAPAGNQPMHPTNQSVGSQAVSPRNQVIPPQQQQPQQQQLVGNPIMTGAGVGTGVYAVQMIPSSATSANNVSLQNQSLQSVSSSPQVLQRANPYYPSASQQQSLNPAAPHFVPLPHASVGGYPPGGGHVSNGLLSTPASGGYHQSTAMYVMGSQQMVYSQGRPSDVTAGGGGGGG